MKSSIVKRSVAIAGHKTSVSLEDAFWSGLKEIAIAASNAVENRAGDRQDPPKGRPLFSDPSVRTRPGARLLQAQYGLQVETVPVAGDVRFTPESGH